MIPTLTIDTDTVARLLEHVRFYGQQDVETGAMLLSNPGEPEISVLALAGEAGITRHYGLLVLSAEALAPLFEYAEDNGLQIRAQVHSHAREAFMSRTDKAGNIRMQGFIAGVVPNFANPSTQPSTWGWWTFDGQNWVDIAPPTLTSPTPGATTVVFDSSGIREQH